MSPPPLLVLTACLCLPLLSPTAAIPEFTIDLDLPPEHRYDHVLPHFNATLHSYYEKFFANDFLLRDALFAIADRRGPEPSDEQQKEIEGIARAVALPLKFISGIQYLYELQTVMVPIVNFTRAETLVDRAAQLVDWDGNGPIESCNTNNIAIMWCVICLNSTLHSVMGASTCIFQVFEKKCCVRKRRYRPGLIPLIPRPGGVKQSKHVGAWR